jgi:hypothetical protein
MSLPVLAPVEPSVIPAKTYDKLWIQDVMISAPHPAQDATCSVRMVKFGVFDGVPEIEPGNNGVWMNIDGILTKSLEDNDLANIIQSLLLYIQKVGIEKGIVAAPSTPAE